MSDIKLHRGDCLDVLRGLADHSVDAVVTDPPYSSGGMVRGDRAQPAAHGKYSGTAKVRLFPEFSGDSRDQRGYLAWCALWLGECRRITKPGGVVVVFTDWRQLPTTTDAIQAGGWIWRGIVPWSKTRYRPQSGRFAAQCEYAVWGSQGAMPVNHAAPCLAGFFSAPPPSAKGRLHLSQKPEGVMERLIAICPEGGTVLDPFLGSGTTGVACVNTGRNFIGCEQNAGYFNEARTRIAAAQKQKQAA